MSFGFLGLLNPDVSPARSLKIQRSNARNTVTTAYPILMYWVTQGTPLPSCYTYRELVPPTQEQQTWGTISELLIPLRAEGQWAILTAWPLPRRGGHSTIPQSKQRCLSQPTSPTDLTTSCHPFILPKTSITSKDGRKALLELNCSWTLNSYLALFHQAACISEGQGKKCDSPLNTGKINFKISLSLP